MALVRLANRFDVLAQHLHEVGHFLTQGALVDGGDLAVSDHDASVDDDRFHAASALR